jgi:copper chaperone NosL
MLMDRRQFITDMTCLTVVSLIFPWSLGADTGCGVAHPLSPPDLALRGQCPNCGMMQSMWARTWKTFRLEDGLREACSFHCLADMAVKSGQTPQDVQTALFLQPRGMVSAAAAWYVVGSSAGGTMTMLSKAAFYRRSAADDFARTCGGEVADYTTTFELARRALDKENAMIDRKRLAKGKIVPPADMQDECVVCRMYPSRYPRHRSQVAYKNGHIDHFCSTHCLFGWLTVPLNRRVQTGQSGMVWVTDYASGRWISGSTAYYVIGSGTTGPMGAEAIAFNRRDQALAFARAEGGQVLMFEQVKARSF